MDQAEKFGQIITEAARTNPKKARTLLSLGCTINEIRSFFPDSRVSDCHRYGSRIVSHSLKQAIAHPEKSAMVSIFIPCEPLAAAGITPLSAEAFSGFASGVHAEQFFLNKTKEDGEPETLCSFHRVFHGAMSTGVLPAPKMILYTNIACDTNQISFPYVMEKYKIPGFYIEVPYEQNEEAVRYVAGQIKEMVTFVSDITKKTISEEKLKASVERGKRTSRYYLERLKYVGKHALKGPVESELYAVYSGHIMMGTKQAEIYNRKTLEDIRQAEGSDAVRLLWLHMIPFLQPSICRNLGYSDKARITAVDLVYDSMFENVPDDPYESMAYRMVHSVYNGDINWRIERALELARQTETEGIVCFAHWGCKATFGASALFTKAFEKEGFPTLILNGDGGDPANCADGQMATRLDAFLEMIEQNRREKRVPEAVPEMQEAEEELYTEGLRI